MTRDKLLNSICPMSRVYDCCVADGDYDCDNCKRLTNEWFDEYDKQIRADAIDEFARKLYEVCNEMIETCGSNTAPISWAEAYADFKVDIEAIKQVLKVKPLCGRKKAREKEWERIKNEYFNLDAKYKLD